MTIVYLASPYTNYPQGRERAYLDVCRAQAYLMNIGFNVFCPIAHTHQAGEILTGASHRFWMDQDKPYMELAHMLVVVRMESWEKSRGVIEEIEYFRKAGKPILYMDLPSDETQSQGPSRP